MLCQMVEQDIFAGPLHWPPQLYCYAVINSEVLIKLAKQDNRENLICVKQQTLSFIKRSAIDS